ncbi:MAG: DUF1045 domain-containing protein, partial [Pseudomonadota bacterium]
MDLSECQRFGIYFTPGPGAFAEFGAAWLGWDGATGRAAGPLEVSGLPMPVGDLTRTPQKYGFHGTLKAPFRLADGTTSDVLLSSVETFGGQTASVTLDGLTVARLGSFVALVPVGDVSALNALAGSIVRAFDGFRAPLRPQELERRRAKGLTPRQDQALLDWGYPHVFEDFRFHMTLTGSLDAEDADQVARVLDRVLQPHLEGPMSI